MGRKLKKLDEIPDLTYFLTLLLAKWGQMLFDFIFLRSDLESSHHFASLSTPFDVIFSLTSPTFQWQIYSIGTSAQAVSRQMQSSDTIAKAVEHGNHKCFRLKVTDDH